MIIYGYTAKGRVTFVKGKKYPKKFNMAWSRSYRFIKDMKADAYRWWRIGYNAGLRQTRKKGARS